MGHTYQEKEPLAAPMLSCKPSTNTSQDMRKRQIYKTEGKAWDMLVRESDSTSCDLPYDARTESFKMQASAAETVTGS